MPAVVRRGDVNAAGGAAVEGANSVLANGRPVVGPGVRVTPHPCCGAPGCQIHCMAVTTGGSGSVIAEGKRVILVGDPDSCGHPRVQGSPDVVAGR